jgi:hypothetical protein
MDERHRSLCQVRNYVAYLDVHWLCPEGSVVAKSDPGDEDLVPHGPTCCNVSSKLSSPSLGHLAQAPWRFWVQTLLHRQIVCEHERGVGARQRLGEVDDRYPLQQTTPHPLTSWALVAQPPGGPPTCALSSRRRAGPFACQSRAPHEPPSPEAQPRASSLRSRSPA